MWSTALEPNDDDEDIIFYNTVNLLLKDNQGGLFISRPFEGGGGLNRDRGAHLRGRGTMVSVLHKELEYKLEKLKNKKVRGYAAEDQKQI